MVNVNCYITIRHCSRSFDLYLFIIMLYSSAKKDLLSFLYHLVCILFGVPSLHLFMYQMFYFFCTIYKCKILLIVNLFATPLYYLQSLSLILTVAVAGSVVAINVLLTKRTVPTMSGSQAMPLFLPDNKPGMQSCSDEFPALNRRTAVRVRSVSSPSNTLSVGRITYHIAL